MNMPDARKIAEAIESIDYYENTIDQIVTSFSNVTFPSMLVVTISVMSDPIEGYKVLEQLELAGNGDSLNSRIHRVMFDAAVQEMDRIRKELLLEIENA